jgi:hypothetical protein
MSSLFAPCFGPSIGEMVAYPQVRGDGRRDVLYTGGG